MGVSIAQYPGHGLNCTREDSTTAFCRQNTKSGYEVLIIIILVATLGFCAPCLADNIASERESPYELFDQGNELMEEGDAKGAIRFYNLALKSNELDAQNRATIILSRAQAKIRANRLKSAANDVRKALSIHGLDGVTRSMGLWIRGQIGLKNKLYNLALQDFTDSIKIHHNDYSLRAATYASRGMTFINMGKNHKAISDLNQAIDLDSSLGFAFACRALARLRVDQLEEARIDCKRALNLEPYGQAASIANMVIKELALPSSVKASLGTVSTPIAENGHIYVRVKFSPSGKGHRFMVDTGATTTVINKELLKEIRNQTSVKAIGKGAVLTADGTRHPVTRYIVKDVYLYHLAIGDMEVLVFDRDSAKVMRVLGVKALKNVKISIDNQEKVANISLIGTVMGR